MRDNYLACDDLARRRVRLDELIEGRVFDKGNGLHGAGHALPDARETQATRKESIHGGLVRGIEDGWQCAARRSGATGEIERREEIGAWSLEIESADCREIKRGTGSGKASGIGQGVLDR